MWKQYFILNHYQIQLLFLFLIIQIGVNEGKERGKKSSFSSVKRATHTCYQFLKYPILRNLRLISKTDMEQKHSVYDIRNLCFTSTEFPPPCVVVRNIYSPFPKNKSNFTIDSRNNSTSKYRQILTLKRAFYFHRIIREVSLLCID